jgi:energy-coupling factor transporter transmembrane protein EcfT
MFFMTSAAGLIAVSRRTARDPRWRSLGTYTLTAGIVAVAGFLAGGALFMPDDAPLHDWAGLYQRALVLAVLFPCRILLSLRLLQVATSRTQSIDTASGAPASGSIVPADRLS